MSSFRSYRYRLLHGAGDPVISAIVETEVEMAFDWRRARLIFRSLADATRACLATNRQFTPTLHPHVFIANSQPDIVDRALADCCGDVPYAWVSDVEFAFESDPDERTFDAGLEDRGVLVVSKAPLTIPIR